jgi:hypothetical protein
MRFRTLQHALAISLALAAVRTSHAAGQTTSDDPTGSRISISYLRSDFARQLAKVRPSEERDSRTQAHSLPVGEVRFGADPELTLVSGISLVGEGGVRGRFLLDRDHLVSTDWSIETTLRGRRSFQCTGRACVITVAAGLRHLSAHGGDEFMNSEHLALMEYSIDGFVAHADVSRAGHGARLSCTRDTRAYGVPRGSRCAEELWVGPRSGNIRAGYVRRPVPSMHAPYEAVYGAWVIALRERTFELHVRAFHGAATPGFLVGATEAGYGTELIIR